MTLAPPLRSPACLSAWLTVRGVPTAEFGRGEAKTLQHLLGELRAGESRIVARDGALLRHVEGAALVVLGTDQAGREVVLVEDHQRFADGRVRRRSLGNSIGEKLTPGEDPAAAARRALTEELGLPVTGDLQPSGIERSRVESTSYPGLVTDNLIHRFVYRLGPGEWREGYVEEQADKRTVFVWEPVLAADEHGVRTATRRLLFAGEAA